MNKLAYIYYTFVLDFQDKENVLHYYFACDVVEETVEQQVLNTEYTDEELIQKLTNLRPNLSDNDIQILDKYLNND
jgi:hypothetical protein